MGWSAMGLMGWSAVGLMGLIWEVSDAGWGWDWWWVLFVCWVDPFDGFDLVLVSYGFDGLIDFDIFSYGFDWFNLRLVASILVLVSLFWSSVLMDLLGFKNMNSHVLGRTWRTRRTSYSKKNNEKKRNSTYSVLLKQYTYAMFYWNSVFRFLFLCVLVEVAAFILWALQPWVPLYKTQTHHVSTTSKQTK